MSRDDDRHWEASADYQCYEVAGEPLALGLSMAERSRPFWQELDQGQLEYARQCAGVLTRYHPHLMEELEAWAHFFGGSEEHFLWYLTLGVRANPSCSAVGILAEPGPLVMRNYDFFYFADTRHLVTTRPDGAFTHIGMFDGLMPGRMDGVNSRGLWVSINALTSKPTQKQRAGLAFHVVVRILLETCSTVSEAIEHLLDMPFVTSNAYFLADDREMAVVETHSSGSRVRYPQEGVLVATNHYLHPHMRQFEHSSVLGNSRARYSFLLDRARQAISSPEPGQVLTDAMKDHRVPVCGHTDGLATFWSARAQPARRDLCYALGAPCRNLYRPVSWPTMVE